MKWAANLEPRDGGETFMGGRVDGYEDEGPSGEIIRTVCLVIMLVSGFVEM